MMRNAACLVGLLSCLARPGAHAATSPADAIVADMHMVKLGPVIFMMGAADATDVLEGAPRHAVNLPAFSMAAYDVTFDDYDAYAHASVVALPDDSRWGRGSRPVINLTWMQMQAFITWLNHATGRYFRLPSEAEWEYAARGGTTTDYWWGPKLDPNDANTQLAGGRDVFAHTSPVGSFPPNPYGLYDTQGNVWQRMGDCYHHTYAGALENGRARTDPPCNAHVVRGGSWFTLARASRVTGRAAAGDDFASSALGFRLAEDQPVAASSLIPDRLFVPPHVGATGLDTPSIAASGTRGTAWYAAVPVVFDLFAYQPFRREQKP